jgi:uncharacterized protein YeaO (DUF488 family)
VPDRDRPVQGSRACYLHDLERDLLRTPKRIRFKRVYESPADTDGARVLVDRLWPRGMTRHALLDEWLPDVAPSTALRKWFGHDPKRFAEFRRRYRAELRANSAALAPLRTLLKRGAITLVYAAKEERFNHAAVLAEFLQKSSRARRRQGRSAARSRVRPA